MRRKEVYEWVEGFLMLLECLLFLQLMTTYRRDVNVVRQKKEFFGCFGLYDVEGWRLLWTSGCLRKQIGAEKGVVVVVVICWEIMNSDCSLLFVHCNNV